MGFREFPSVVLRGIGKIAFSGRVTSGILIALAIALLAPWGAAGALIGSVAGTLVTPWVVGGEAAGWRAGWYGYNPAILGILWGGVLGSDALAFLLFVPALSLCILLDLIIRRMSARLHLPPLAFASLLAGWLSALAFHAYGKPFWVAEGLLPFGSAGAAAAVACLTVALVQESPPAALQTAALTAAVALGSGMLVEDSWLGPVGLWGFTVVPACFGVSGIFLRDSSLGRWAGILAALIGAGVWAVWPSLVGGIFLPPLMMPFVLGTWAALGFVLIWSGGRYLVFDPAFWRAAAWFREARSVGRGIVALTGAGVSTASGIPDYTSGEWLEFSDVVEDYSFGRFMKSQKCREKYWKACLKFQGVAQSARPNPAHLGLAALERRGWLSAVITQNVDRLHHLAGSGRVIELHGRIDRIHCLGCGHPEPWKSDGLPEAGDPRCEKCGGLLKPAVIAMGEPIPVSAWAEAEQEVARCGLIAVIGTQLLVSSAAALVSAARKNGARVLFINTDPGPARETGMAEELFLACRAEEAIPALSFLLNGGRSNLIGDGPA